MICNLNEKFLVLDTEFTKKLNNIIDDFLESVVRISNHYIELNNEFNEYNSLSDEEKLSKDRKYFDYISNIIHELFMFKNMSNENQKINSLGIRYGKKPLFVDEKDILLNNTNFKIRAFLQPYPGDQSLIYYGSYTKNTNIVELYWYLDSKDIIPVKERTLEFLKHELTHAINNMLSYYKTNNSFFFMVDDNDLNHYKNTELYSAYKFMKENDFVNYILYVLWDDDELTAYRTSNVNTKNRLYNKLSNYLEKVKGLSDEEILLLKDFMCSINKKYEKIKNNRFKDWFIKNSRERLNKLLKS